jgi:hypothetical protein
MVVPDAALARLASGLPHRFAFFSTAEDAAASSPDPRDTGATMKRRGRIAGYVRGRNTPSAFARRAPKRLLAIGTSVILWRDARAAAASIERDLADEKRLTGRTVGGNLLISFSATRVPSLGAGAVLQHIRARPLDGTDRFTTQVVLRVGRLRGNAIVVRGDRRDADSLALRLARQLRRRMLAALR